MDSFLGLPPEKKAQFKNQLHDVIEQLVIEHKNGLKNLLNIIRKSNIRIRT